MFISIHTWTDHTDGNAMAQQQGSSMSVAWIIAWLRTAIGKFSELNVPGLPAIQKMESYLHPNKMPAKLEPGNRRPMRNKRCGYPQQNGQRQLWPSKGWGTADVWKAKSRSVHSESQRQIKATETREPLKGLMKRNAGKFSCFHIMSGRVWTRVSLLLKHYPCFLAAIHIDAVALQFCPLLLLNGTHFQRPLINYCLRARPLWLRHVGNRIDGK